MSRRPHFVSRVLFAFAGSSVALSGAIAQTTGTPFYGDPPDRHHPWAVHDRNRPQPPRVEPGAFSTPDKPGKPPSDAIVLFDGTVGSLEKWEADTKPGEPHAPTKWIVKDGALECVPKSGMIRTKAQFGDCHLHVEWAAPAQVQGTSQGRGNSGIFLMGRAEVQVLDNYENPTYADGFANSVYGINPPLVNPLRPPGEFQVVDIVFRRPIFRDGKQIDPGYMTVFCNGVLVQDHTSLEGPGGHLRRSVPVPFPDQGPLKLQDHGNPVRFRNIWVRKLPPRAIEGGTEGALSPEATAALRQETAARLRADAAKLTGDPRQRMLRLAESLVYAPDPATLREVTQLATQHAEAVRSLSGGALAQRQEEIESLVRAYQYLVKWNVLPADFAPLMALTKIVKAQGWDQKKK